MFELPRYKEPDFSDPGFANAPDAAYGEVTIDGVAPENYHSTSMYPEYFKINGTWTLARESRMDSSVVLRDSGELDVVENRNLKKGDKVILGRTENGKRASTCTAPDLNHRRRQTATSSFSGRAEAGRLLMPEITTVFLSCSNTKENTETFSGLWDLPFLSTLTPEEPCRPWWSTDM